MMTFLLTVAALAGTNGSTVAGPLDGGDAETIVVEGRRSERDWMMPKMDFDEPDDCPAFVESEVPGFGVLRLSKGCAIDRTEGWRLFQY